MNVGLCENVMVKEKNALRKILFSFSLENKKHWERERELFKENMLTILGKAEFPGEDSPSLSEI